MTILKFKKERLKQFSLIQKFILSYCVLILVPLLIIFLYTYTKMSKLSYDNLLKLTNQSFEQSKNFIDYKLSRIFDISNSIVVDSELSNILTKDPSNYTLNQEVIDLYKLRDFTSLYQYNKDISNVRIYVNNNFNYLIDNVNIFKINSIEESKAFYDLNSMKLRFLWYTQTSIDSKDITYSNDYLSLLKPIKNPSDYTKDIGYLILNFEKSSIKDIVNKINPIDGGISYIVDSSGMIITSSESNEFTKNPVNIDVDIIKYYADNQLPQSKIIIDNNNYYIQSYLLNKTDWYLVNILSEKNLLAEINPQKAYLIYLSLFCAFTSILIAVLFVKSINRRLSKVIKGMREVNNGNFDYYIEDNKTDELGELTSTYNYMVKTITILNREQYDNGKSVKNAELKALQSQINPHFLYNTLDMINWMSYKNQNEEIRLTVKSLVQFYKLSLNKGKDLSTIHDELLHISVYVQIQNMRYNNRITLKIDIDKSIEYSSIPKITLQPIVENAINHGILAKGGENGTITISGYLENDDIILKISDDGIGITDEYIELILTEGSLKSTGSGYGLKNINTRLKLTYGNNYGLAFINNDTIGTTVIIKIPKTN